MSDDDKKPKHDDATAASSGNPDTLAKALAIMRLAENDRSGIILVGGSQGQQRLERQAGEQAKNLLDRVSKRIPPEKRDPKKPEDKGGSRGK